MGGHRRSADRGALRPPFRLDPIAVDRDDGVLLHPMQLIAPGIWTISHGTVEPLTPVRFEASGRSAPHG